MQKLTILLFMGLTLSFLNIKAQKIDKIYIAGMSETASFPFTRISPIHPGIEIGASFFEKPIFLKNQRITLVITLMHF